jgi:hypothetical protein
VSRKPESVFITSVHKHLPKSLYRIKNNNPFAGGQPDCWYSGPKADLWVEYKFVARLPKAGVKAELSDLQIQWLHDRHKEGRNVAVIIGCKEGGVTLRDLAWANVIPVLDFNQNIKTRHDLARWIQAETGESNDQIRSSHLPGA